MDRTACTEPQCLYTHAYTHLWMPWSDRLAVETKKLALMPPVGFEPTIPTREQLQPQAFDRAATETVFLYINCPNDYPLPLMSP